MFWLCSLSPCVPNFPLDHHVSSILECYAVTIRDLVFAREWRDSVEAEEFVYIHSNVGCQGTLRRVRWQLPLLLSPPVSKLNLKKSLDLSTWHKLKSKMKDRFAKKRGRLKELDYFTSGRMNLFSFGPH